MKKIDDFQKFVNEKYDISKGLHFIAEKVYDYYITQLKKFISEYIKVIYDFNDYDDMVNLFQSELIKRYGFFLKDVINTDHLKNKVSDKIFKFIKYSNEILKFDYLISNKEVGGYFNFIEMKDNSNGKRENTMKIIALNLTGGYISKIYNFVKELSEEEVNHIKDKPENLVNDYIFEMPNGTHILVHELKHAYDEFYSNGKYITEPKKKKPKETQKEYYLKIPYEIKARLHQTLYRINDLTRLNFQNFINVFKEKFNGWEYLNQKEKRKIIKNVYDYYLHHSISPKNYEKLKKKIKDNYYQKQIKDKFKTHISLSLEKDVLLVDSELSDQNTARYIINISNLYNIPLGLKNATQELIKKYNIRRVNSKFIHGNSGYPFYYNPNIDYY